MFLFSQRKIFVIAEMANSHEGSLLKAKKITENAAKAGADAIKFSKFITDELVEPNHKNYLFYKNLEMKPTEWKELINFAKKKKLKVFVDVDGLKSAKEISKLDIDGYKIHASDISNPLLLEYLATTDKPILLSAAGAELNEIDEAIKILSKISKELIIMHGFQGYPTKLKDLNLKRITELSSRYNFPIGIMDHVGGDSKMALIAPLLAVSVGANVVEKHITLDRSEKGLDYYSALNPNEFSELVKLIRLTEKSLGKSQYILSKNELKYKLNHKKNTIAKSFIKKGTTLNEKLFEFKRTQEKKHSVAFYEFKDKIASKNIAKGQILVSSMISKKSEKRAAAVIACRVGSDRLFGKPLQLVGNFTILELLINQIKKSKIITDIVLAISEKPGNEVFVEFAKQHKLKFVRGDDKDVLKRLIDGAKYVNAEIVFRVTPENPYMYWEKIDPVIQQHIKSGYDYTTILPIPLGAGFEVIDRKALEISHRFGSSIHRSEHCDLYIAENQDKFKINVYKPEKNVQRPDLRLTVDTPQDLILVRKIYEKLGNDGKPIPFYKIIKFLDRNPDIARINSDVIMKHLDLARVTV